MVFTLGSFVLVTVLVAFVSWLKTRGTDETSKDGYFLGGRSLSGLVIFGSLMMTNLSAEQLVDRNGQGYAAGMTAMGWETMCPIALTLMALFFIPKYFKLGISTIPEFLESRFDRATRVIVSFIFLVAYIVAMLPLVLYAGSVAMERIFGITALMGGNRFMATTVMCVALGIIGGIYAIFGGLKAVAVSDSLNGIIFIIGAVILIPALAFIALGDGSIAEGIRIFATSSPEHLNAIQPADAQPPYIPWPMIVLGCGINHISYWCTNQSIMQRVLGAKNLKEAQKGSLLTGLTCVFCPIFLVAPDVIQFIYYRTVPAVSAGRHQHLPQSDVGLLRRSGSAIVVMGILAPRMPSFAPKAAILVHIVCYGLMMNLLPFHFLYFEVGAFAIDLILMAILTKAAPRKEAYVLPDLEVVDMTPWKYRKPVIAVTFILLAGIYVLFSPLGLGG